MKLQEYDAFALRSYSFAFKKTNSYFSLGSVLLSLLIVVAAFLVNLNTMSHLWLERSELPITSSRTLSLPPPLTESLVCYSAPLVAGVLPRALVFNEKLEEVPLRVLPAKQVRGSFPLFAKQLEDDFLCFDFAGVEFTKENMLFYVAVDSNDSKLYLRCASEKRLIYGEADEQILFAQGLNSLSISQAFPLRFSKLSISDSLYGGQIESYSTFKKVKSFYPEISPRNQAIHKEYGNVFQLRPFYPDYIRDVKEENYNVFGKEITRNNIGFMVGAMLTWISIFSLFFAFAVAPLMEAALDLKQVEAIFHLGEDCARPSVLKYIAASFRRGVFAKEDRFVALAERLSHLKNVGAILKLQQTIRSELLGQQRRDAEETIVNLSSFEQEAAEGSVGSFSEEAQQSQGSFEAKAEENRDSAGLALLRQRVLKWFDSGSDPVSVSYDSQGYGSAQSFVLSALFIIGFVFLLLGTGTFSMQTTSSTMSKPVNQLQHSLYKNEIVFASQGKQSVTFALYDGNFLKIKDIIAIEGSDCYNSLSSSQKSTILKQGDFTYCLPQGITLKYDVLNPQKSILFGIDALDLITVNVVHFQLQGKTPSSVPILKVPNTLSPKYSFQQFYYQMLMEITQLSNADGEFQITQIKALSNPIKNTFSNDFKGYIIRLGQETIQIVETTDNFFDFLANIWGFSVICFSVVLMKATKYINLRQKDKKVSLQKSDFRDNICVLASKVHQIQNGRTSDQIAKAKYHLKSSLPI